jgi:hypothetical protein
VIYDVSLDIYVEWREYASVGLNGIALWRIVLWQSMMPIWKGLARGVLGLFVLFYCTSRLIRREPANYLTAENDAEQALGADSP